VKRRSNLRLWLRLHVRLCKRCTWRFSPLNAGSRQQSFVGLLQILDEFLFFASSSKCLVPKDHAEVCAIARAVILTGVTGRNGYPDRYNQAFAFSAILYSASLRHPLRSAFRLARERSGLPRFGSITKSVRSRLDAVTQDVHDTGTMNLYTSHLPFGYSVSASCAVYTMTARERRFRYLDHTIRS
jgi:hypothetical protein